MSAVVNPVGRLIAHSEVRDVQHGSWDSPDILLATVHWMKGGKTVYEVVGDSLWWMATALIAVLAFVRRKRSPVGA